MSSIKVNIKWGKNLYNDIDLNLEDDIATFKCQVYALTNVPIDKQKLMAKGKIIKDTEEWSKYPGVKEGLTMMLMGTAEGNELKAPEVTMKFVEDMTPEEKAKALREKTGIVIPAGLENLGNTCYMNSVVQCLKRVNELKQDLKDFKLDDQAQQTIGAGDPNIQMASAARGLMNDLDDKGESFAPYAFVETMRKVFPIFDETDDKGHHKQQDADECYTSFMAAFQYALKYSASRKQAPKNTADVEMNGEEEKKQDSVQASADPIQSLFGIEMETTEKCVESEAEPETVKTENAFKLPCHIDNNNNPINSLQDGLDISMKGEIEKFSNVLQKNAVFNRTQKVNSLPSYLCINFVRFYWKQESAVGGTKAGRAKILRSVMYPRVLDLYQFCSDSLKVKLDAGRELEQTQRAADDAARLEGKKKQAEESDKQVSGETQAINDEDKERNRLVGQAAKQAQLAEEAKAHDELLYRPHGQGKDTGNYELVAVVTHKGRSADGGHYVGWVHQAGDNWLCFDDDIVTSVKTEEILALRGGGDWHTAYLCIYRKLETNKA